MLFKVGPAPVVDKATGVAKAITDAQAISGALVVSLMLSYG